MEHRSNYLFSYEFLRSTEYQVIGDFSHHTLDLLSKEAFVERKGKKQAVNSFVDALDWLLNEAKQGHTSTL